jgi:hypothetical protein
MNVKKDVGYNMNEEILKVLKELLADANFG